MAVWLPCTTPQPRRSCVFQRGRLRPGTSKPRMSMEGRATWIELISMDNIWNTAIKVTGPVGVVGLLLWTLFHFLFREDVIALFGSGKLFVLAVILVSCLFIALITAILVYRDTKKADVKPPENKPHSNKVIINRSKIDGDFVMGNKTVNSRKDND